MDVAPGPDVRRASLIMWTWQDAQVDDPALVEAALGDIADRGFSGALAMLRGCRYELDDPAVVVAAGHAADQAHRAGMTFWFALDPRLVQGRLTALPGGRATFILTERTATEMPGETAVADDGRYRLRMSYRRPRSQHMLSQVAATFEPAGLESVVAYRRDPDGRVLTDSLRDVSGTARLFVQRDIATIEIHGRAPGLAGGGWHVLGLARFASTYPELGSGAVRDSLLELYRDYHRAAVHLDGVVWDEIGYVTGYGQDRCRLPWGDAIHTAFEARTGAPLPTALPYLLLDDDAGHAVRARRAYYAAVQDVVVDLQRRCYEEARDLWGPQIESGIHQTWHQNADDLPHGTGDWWRASDALSGGFSDVGDADDLANDERYDEVLTMTVIAGSLARHHVRQNAFCNLWGVDYGTRDARAPARVVDWWAHLLGGFGITWLAHTYGPNGYIDHDTGWGPGYPDHPTWQHLEAINDRLATLRRLTGDAPPEADVAVVWPVESLAARGDVSANALALDVRRTVSGLVQRGLAVDVVSPDLFAGGQVVGDRLLLRSAGRQRRYRAVVYPRPETIQPAEVAVLRALRTGRIPAQLLGRPVRTTEGETLVGEDLGQIAADDELPAVTAKLPRLVDAPEGAFANLFRRPDGSETVVVAPLALDRWVDGPVRTGPHSFDVAGLRGIAAVRYGATGEVVERWCHDGRVDTGAEDAR
jgi:hypothetical protein